MESGYLQSRNGHKSSSRLFGGIMIIVGLIYAQEVLLWGLKKGQISDLFMICTSAGTIFGTIAGPAMLFLFGQKKTELSAPLPKTNPDE